MKTSILSFNGINNVGMYGFITNKYALIGQDVPEKYEEEIEKTLQVPIYKLTIAGTSFLGAFLSGNEDKLLVPNIAFEEELQILKKAGIEYEVVNTKFTCLGNNIVIGKKGILINPELTEAEAKRISKIFSLDYKQKKYSNINSVGSIFVINKTKALVSNNLSESDVKELEEFLGLEITTGTLNMGNQYVKTGILCNENGYVVGKGTGGPEIVNAEEALYD
ncbi:MAG: translation initiation factor IF-6 [Candidatus Woesearchaeota archaeon]